MLNARTKSCSGGVTLPEIEAFLRVKEDKCRALLIAWGLSGRRTVAWEDLWTCLGLDQNQDVSLHKELKQPLLLPAEVAPLLGISVATVNLWCRTDACPEGFPQPIRLGPRKKAWIFLEIMAHRNPEIYGASARGIRRREKKPSSPTRPNITLDPDLSVETLAKSSSPGAELANIQSIDPGMDGYMLQDLDELVATIEATEADAPTPANTMMDKVIQMLDAEIQAGEARSPRTRTKSAIRSLLGVKGRSPENTELSLDLFDAWFPIDGWSQAQMPNIKLRVYRDYRKRARAAISRAMGLKNQRKESRQQKDRWTELATWLHELPGFKNPELEFSSLTSTLTLLSREAGLSTEDLTQEVLMFLYRNANQKEKRSLRNAARIIKNLQENTDISSEVRTFFPRKIAKILTGPNRKYNIPEHMQAEIEKFATTSSQKKYIKIAEKFDELQSSTKTQHIYTLRTVVGALLDLGLLQQDSITIRSALSDPSAMIAACKYILKRVRQGELAASTSATRMSFLSPVLERNGIFVPDLRVDISDVPEFRLNINQSHMPEETQAICKKIIDDVGLRADFLLSHASPRAEANKLIKLAKLEKRCLTHKERTRVRQLGTVALFCALECGCAPIRSSNFLAITTGADDSWFTDLGDAGYKLYIPAAFTKNKKPIKAYLKPSDEKYLETVRWFMENVRWLFFWETEERMSNDPKEIEKFAKGMANDSTWLVPGIKNPSCYLGYQTFSGWFKSIMRKEVGIDMDPHNFRHGQASLLYFYFPDQIETIAIRLGDTIDTTLRYYAWVHEEKLMQKGQENLVSLIRPMMAA